MDKEETELYFEFCRTWNDGNWHSAIGKINRLVSRVAERAGAVGNKPNQVFDGNKFYFVNCAITEEDWPRVAECYLTPESVWDGLSAVLNEGIKVSFALNSKNDLTICSLSDRREGSSTLGACLTGGADGWYDALRVTLYKYTALLHGDFGEGEKGSSNRARII